MTTEPGVAPDFAPFPEDDWERALAVVAHPDDLEYGAASAIARWVAQGKTVSYLLASRGEAGIDGMEPSVAGPVRVAEQEASAATVGVHTVEFLDYPDGTIEYGLPLRRDITAAIRRRRPELVITGNHHESWPHGGWNMADHRNVGLAVLDAVRDAGNRWVFTDLPDAAWSGVRRVAVNASPQSTHAVDISATLDRGIASLQEHRAYLAGLADHPMTDAAAFLRMVAEMTGERFGGRLATAFELFEM